MRLLIVVVALAVLAHVCAVEQPGASPALGLKKAQTPSKAPTRPSKAPTSAPQGKSDPKKLAAEALLIFRDADGSALFRGNKVDPKSVAEVPPKSPKPTNPVKLNPLSPVKTPSPVEKGAVPMAGLKAGYAKGAKGVKGLGVKGGAKGDAKKQTPAKPTDAPAPALTDRQKRPLFDFSKVPADVTGVALRKHAFSTKHHKLIADFANKNPAVTTVIVVDTFVGAQGRPSKKAGDTKMRGTKKTDVDIKGVRNGNLFIFNEKKEQLFPSNKKPDEKKPEEKKPKDAKGAKGPKKSGMDKATNAASKLLGFQVGFATK